MYLATVVLLLLVLPLLSVAVEMLWHGAAMFPLIAKWFVFWPVGVRLFLGGVRQVSQPQFTSREIFGISDPVAGGLVREIGFGNLAMGTLGLLTLLRPGLILGAAIAGGLYYLLAGIGHVARGHLKAKGMTALVSDLAIAALLAVVVVRLW